MSICKNCGKEFIQKKHKNARSCSKSCGVSLRNKTIGLKNKETRICIVCKVEFETKKSSTKKFCSLKCRDSAPSPLLGKKFTEEHKVNISKARIGVSSPKPNGTILTKKWWIYKGFSEEEAIKRVSEIQSRNSKKMLEKYGENYTYEDIYGDKSEEMRIQNSENMKKYHESLSLDQKEILKKKNSEGVARFWSGDSERSLELKKEFSEKLSSRNREEWSEKSRNFSEAKKEEIKNKKRSTFLSRPEEEILAINRSRYENSFLTMKYHKYFINVVSELSGELKVNSKYEADFIRICDKLHILVERGPTVSYKYDESFHNYYIDFIIRKEEKSFLIELKGDHIFYKKELETGVARLKIEAAEKYSKENNIEYIFIFKKNNEEIKEILEKL